VDQWRRAASSNLSADDIATGWTECAPLLVREQRLLTEVLSELRKVLPFTLLGLEYRQRQRVHERDRADYCEKAGVEFTRCRPYRKNDQAWVEQKNGAVVRRTVGYRRFEGLEAAAVLARLYAAMRLFVNFSSPRSSWPRRLVRREGQEALSPPATPCQRLLQTADEPGGATPAERAARLPWTRFVSCRRFVRPSSSSSKLPTPRSSAIRRSLPRRRSSSSSLGCARSGRRVKCVDKRAKGEAQTLAAPARSVGGGHDGAARVVRGRALAHIGELFERLQAEYPGVYPDGQLRTLQRRVKECDAKSHTEWYSGPR